MTQDELDRLWANPRNWGLVYRCAEDPRVIVPRRYRWMGWTINFAHALAWPVLALCFAIGLGPFLILIQFGVTSRPILAAVLIASVLLLVGLSYWEATRSRR